MRCPACGSEDFRGYGFCVNCGATFPKETRQAFERAPVQTAPPAESLEQMRKSVTVALIVVGVFIVFFYVYLYLMGADPFLILVVEAFPVFWMIAILMRWRRARQELGGKGNAK
jgi:hypothetical protein